LVISQRIAGSPLFPPSNSVSFFFREASNRIFFSLYWNSRSPPLLRKTGSGFFAEVLFRFFFFSLMSGVAHAVIRASCVSDVRVFFWNLCPFWVNWGLFLPSKIPLFSPKANTLLEWGPGSLFPFAGLQEFPLYVFIFRLCEACLERAS